MKKHLIIIFLLFSAGFLIMQSCVKKDFDAPEKIVPSSNLQVNATIMDLKDYLPSDSLIRKIDTNYIIEGYVSANDESGNLYKTIYIQDSTTGIELKLDASYLNTQYKIGQKLKIKCQGLYIGTYGGVKQLGYLYAGSVGRIPEMYIKEHIFADGWPETKPTPKTIKIKNINNDLVGTLIKIEKVTFLDTNTTFANTLETVNRAVKQHKSIDSIGGYTIYIRTSNYANFALKKLPTGYGDITGILSKFDNDYQIYIRDLNDMGIFDSTLINPNEPSDVLYPTEINNAVTNITENFDGIVNLTDFYKQYWTNQASAGTRKWQGKTYNADKYIQATAYNSIDNQNTCWVITPPIVYNSNHNLSFKTATAYWKHNGLQVFILYNYDGYNINNAIWTDVTSKFTIASQSNSNYQWVNSGTLNLNEIIPSTYSGNYYFCFKYSGNKTSNTSTYCIDNILTE